MIVQQLELMSQPARKQGLHSGLAQSSLTTERIRKSENPASDSVATAQHFKRQKLSSSSDIVRQCLVEEQRPIQHEGCSLSQGHTHVGSCFEQPEAISNAPNDDVKGRELPRVDVPSDLVCYGTIEDFDKLDISWNEGTSTAEVDAWWNGLDKLILDDDQECGLSTRCRDILLALHQEASAIFEFCINKHVQVVRYAATAKGRKTESRRASLNVTIYGPREAAEEVGSWLDEVDLYLQIPSRCKHNMPYYNPHAMTANIDNATMTFDLTFSDDSSKSQVGIGAIGIQSCQNRDWPEARQPAGIKSCLYRHQLQALSFLQARELGWDLDDDRATNDLWRREINQFGRDVYTLPLSQHSQFRTPTEFRGGILADEMGLGKTCTMLALIASDLEGIRSKAIGSHSMEGQTLIIAPVPLLQVWEQQITVHLTTDFAICCTYHGSSKDGTDTANCDIVLTSYHTIAREWKRFKKGLSHHSKPVLFARKWRRIVLDEAHAIRNSSTNIANAVSAVDAERRWCITGTPIQNRAADIYALVRFLKIHPYDKYKSFDATFIRPWVQCADDAALQKLQVLMSTISIRRPRHIVELPRRYESLRKVSFNEVELAFYRAAKQGALQSIENAFVTEQRQVGVCYLNALQRINDMRHICNHGSPSQRKQHHQRAKTQRTMLEQELCTILVPDTTLDMFCITCGKDLYQTFDDDELLKATKQDSSVSQCSECVGESDLTSVPSPNGPSFVGGEPDSETTNSKDSSKIRALVEEIQRTHAADKCVVFSFWTNTLKLVKHSLEHSRVSCLLYDGSLSRTKRDVVLQQFSEDPRIKVMLISITCGGQGLDLTPANHAFLLEPQWNPMLEEQAMARVHRLGQTKDVQLVRLIVERTWEEKIMRLQEGKRMLADLIVDRKGMQKGENARKQLEWLKDLVS